MLTWLDLLRPSAWWLVVIPLIFCLPIYLLREPKQQAVLSLLACGWLILAAWFVVPLGVSTTVEQWPLYLDRAIIYIITLFAVATMAFIWVAMAVKQTAFPPVFGVILLSLTTFALLNLNLETGLFVMAFAALLTPFVIQGNRVGSTRASLRVVVMVVLALLSLILLVQTIDQLQTDGNVAQPSNQLVLLAGVGFGLLLGVVPFQAWVSSLVAEAEPAIAAFILILFPTVTVLFLYRLINTMPALANEALLQHLFFWVGCLTMVVAGFFGWMQRTPQALLGYTAIFDVGLICIAISAAAEITLAQLLLLLTVRALGLLLITLSLASLRQPNRDGIWAGLSPLNQTAFIPMAGLLAGGGTLLGGPFTLGYVSRWWLFQSTVIVTPMGSLAFVVGTVALALGYVRLALQLFPTGEIFYLPQSWGEWQQLLGISSDNGLIHAEPNRYRTGLSLIIIGLIGLSIGLGLFPKPLLDLLQSIGQSLGN